MKKVFIVPYRDREPQKAIFLSHMKTLLKGEKDYEIIFAHQKDKRKFNRGGMRNIAFIYVKKTYNNWKDITLVFHDIDYLPYKKMFNYDTLQGVVTHFYGLKPAFGGIWAIKGIDFEKIGGFPNYWAWGFEDNKIRSEWIKSGGKINYDQFVEYTDARIVKLDCSNYGHDTRIVNKHNLWYAQNANYISGYHTIRDLKYDVKVIENNIKMLDITKFYTEKKESSQIFVEDVNQKQIVQDYRLRVQKLENKNKKAGQRFDSRKPETWRGRTWKGLGFGGMSHGRTSATTRVMRRSQMKMMSPKVPGKKDKKRRKIRLNLLNRRKK